MVQEICNWVKRAVREEWGKYFVRVEGSDIVIYDSRRVLTVIRVLDRVRGGVEEEVRHKYDIKFYIVTDLRRWVLCDGEGMIGESEWGVGYEFVRGLIKRLRVYLFWGYEGKGSESYWVCRLGEYIEFFSLYLRGKGVNEWLRGLGVGVLDEGRVSRLLSLVFVMKLLYGKEDFYEFIRGLGLEIPGGVRNLFRKVERRYRKDVGGFKEVFKSFDFGYDVLGKVYEKILSYEDRVRFGQYYTSADLVDFILGLCMKGGERVLDGGCGTGAFLLRAVGKAGYLCGVEVMKLSSVIAKYNLCMRGVDFDIYNIDFFDFMGDKFDVVVGNPPYVRDENLDKEKVSKVLGKVDMNADLYVYFIMHSTKLLRDGGYLGYVMSDTWMGVEYGRQLREFLLRNYKIKFVISSDVEDWFRGVKVGTCVLILEKCSDKEERESNVVRFVTLRKPVKEINFSFEDGEDMKVCSVRQGDLSSDEKWSVYMRAPGVYYRILGCGLKKLGEVAEVRCGVKSEAVEFFYLTEDEIRRWGIEEEFWKHRIEGELVPNYAMRYSKECKRVEIDEKDLRYRVLLVHRNKEELKGMNVLRYIEDGERRGIHKRASVMNRKRWYDLGELRVWRVVISFCLSRRFVCFYNRKSYIDNNLVGVEMGDEELNKMLCVYMNSSLVWMFPDILGRRYGGYVELKEVDVRGFLVPDFLNMEEWERRRFLELFEVLRGVEVGSVFYELGANTVEEVSFERVRGYRRELDKFIMGDVLGLSEDEQLEVYRAVIDLFSKRIGRVKKWKNKKIEKVDFEKLKREVLERIRSDGIQFEMSGRLVELPILSFSDRVDVKVEKGLFGWKVVCGGKSIVCSSEDEARYLSIFIDIGLNKVRVPGDGDLKGVVRKLEGLKSKVDGIINEYFAGVDYRIRNRLRYEIYVELLGGLSY